MSFRPYPVLTVFTLLGLALLVWLGAWQYRRAEWKSDRIDAYNARAALDAVALETAACASDERFDGAIIAPAPVGEAALRVYGFSTDGDPGWRLFRPVTAPDCEGRDADRLWLAELGFEPFAGGPSSSIPRLRFDAPPSLDKPTFASDNAPDRNEWYWFDRPAMAAAISSAAGQLAWDRILVADDGMPREFREVPPERHVGYSVTWFGLAMALLVLYVAFHVRAGRLTFGAKT